MLTGLTSKRSEIVTGICDGRVAIVTGAGRGIGRSHALELARCGAKVVVNDLGVALDGTGSSTLPADEVVEEIRSLGGEAIAHAGDASDWEMAQRLAQVAVDAFGRLDILVNNAGILRDRMLVNLEADEWDAVLRVHLRGTLAPMRWAGSYWRDQSKGGNEVDARVINTTSASGLYGGVGQSNYASAKAAIATLSMVAARELERYGVTVNAIAPGARTRLSEGVAMMRVRDDGIDRFRPEYVSQFVAWLASKDSHDVTGQVFEVSGAIVALPTPWQKGPAVKPDLDRISPEEYGRMAREVLSKRGQERPRSK
jgi:NAD(P)-dependent dehydrogenase (short-subunit alcohol dehydrogenase family)